MLRPLHDASLDVGNYELPLIDAIMQRRSYYSDQIQLRGGS